MWQFNAEREAERMQAEEARDKKRRTLQKAGEKRGERQEVGDGPSVNFGGSPRAGAREL